MPDLGYLAKHEPGKFPLLEELLEQRVLEYVSLLLNPTSHHHHWQTKLNTIRFLYNNIDDLKDISMSMKTHTKVTATIRCVWTRLGHICRKILCNKRRHSVTNLPTGLPSLWRRKHMSHMRITMGQLAKCREKTPKMYLLWNHQRRIFAARFFYVWSGHT